MTPLEEPSEKPKPRSLAGRIAALRESPAIGQATRAANAYVAKALAKLNELLARLNAKK